MNEMWSFVGNKGNPRWLWHAIDHHTGAVLAYVFGRRKDEVFLRLKALLEPFGLTRFYTDHWGAYTRHLDPDVHSPGKRNTQKIERQHLTLQTRGQPDHQHIPWVIGQVLADEGIGTGALAIDEQRDGLNLLSLPAGDPCGQRLGLLRTLPGLGDLGAQIQHIRQSAVGQGKSC